jgi:penicillin V acylase-like amidase (Ntn superfamily)
VFNEIMNPGHYNRAASAFLATVILGVSMVAQAIACTRTLYVGDDNTVITGRNMDWKEDMASNLWVFPAGMQRDGAAGPRSIQWTSNYGTVIVSGYEAGTTDGMNEKGLVANLLYLAESDYGKLDEKRPFLSIAAWAQYVLDNYATVTQAVDALSNEPFQILAPTLPNGAAAALHLAISDATGDSAIFEYVEGKLTIHHGKQYTVMTNSPIYSRQLALNEYWESIGGLAFLPGTNRAADRFARASFLIGAIPKHLDKAYINGVPKHSYEYQAVAGVLSVQRAVSVPLGITTPDQPNISSTIWRSVSDQKNLLYYFDSATRPNTFWVSLNKLNLKPGATAKKLTIQNGEIFSGEVADQFTDAKPFKFLQAQAPAD